MYSVGAMKLIFSMTVNESTSTKDRGDASRTFRTDLQPHIQNWSAAAHTFVTFLWFTWNLNMATNSTFDNIEI